MNTPNKITLARILLIPVIMFFYLETFFPWGKFVAGIIFIVACLTDFLDGYLARKNNQVTTLGKFLDTIADKLLVMTALILLVATPIKDAPSIFYPIQWLGIVCSVIILAREFLVSALRQVAATKNIVLAADKSGKVKACFQYVTLALYFFYAFAKVEFYNPNTASQAGKIANMICGVTLIVLLCVTTILTITSGLNYFLNNTKVFKDSQKSVEDKKNVVAEQTNEMVSKDVVISENDRKSQTTNSKTKSKAKQSTKNSASKKTTTKNATKPAPKPINPNKDKNGRPLDILIPKAFDIFINRGQASTTMLQKHMGIGYPRASKIVDQMEELGIISAGDRTNARKVLIGKEDFKKFEHLFK